MPNTFGEFVIRKLTERSLNISQAASQTRVSYETLRKSLRRGKLSERDATKVAEFLECTVDDLQKQGLRLANPYRARTRTSSAIESENIIGLLQAVVASDVGEFSLSDLKRLRKTLTAVGATTPELIIAILKAWKN